MRSTNCEPHFLLQSPVFVFCLLPPMAMRATALSARRRQDRETQEEAVLLH